MNVEDDCHSVLDAGSMDHTHEPQHVRQLPGATSMHGALVLPQHRCRSCHGANVRCSARSFLMRRKAAAYNVLIAERERGSVTPMRSSRTLTGS